MKILVEQDSLTGIMNRMAIENHLEKILAMNRGVLDRCMVQIIDVDNFKEINDRYGHDAGDQVLIQLARIFSANIRDVDQVGRWGGDEFVIVFKGIAESAVQPMVQRIQGAVRDYDWSNILTASQAKVSISIGYTICEDKESKHDVLKRADDHLYTSKSHGRDCARGE
jgi:diguanylate cyclase (GGDEF)-like protein